MQRQFFICESVKDCTETSECCPHKTPHIKDERCVPKECRFGPASKVVDCVLADPANPHVPKVKEVLVAKTVEERMKEEPVQYVPGSVTTRTEELIKNEEVVPPIEEKKAEPAQRPVTLRKKPGRKASK
jgi:hypothetical protein